jgi:hypothetical protein
MIAGEGSEDSGGAVVAPDRLEGGSAKLTDYSTQGVKKVCSGMETKLTTQLIIILSGYNEIFEK